MKYGVDCERVFGYFLHHFPYVGLRGEADLEAHHRMGERMKELYEETFGDDYLHAATAWSASPPQERDGMVRLPTQERSNGLVRFAPQTDRGAHRLVRLAAQGRLDGMVGVAPQSRAHRVVRVAAQG